MSRILDIKDLAVRIDMRHKSVTPVDGVTLHIDAGETLGIVGESGCGKSMTGLSIMQLLPPGGHIVGGSVEFMGRDLAPLNYNEMHEIRGNDIAMIFQDPMTSLNPTKTIGDQVAEPVRIHRGANHREALDRAVEVLGLVGLPRPKERFGDYGELHQHHALDGATGFLRRAHPSSAWWQHHASPRSHLGLKPSGASLRGFQRRS